LGGAKGPVAAGPRRDAGELFLGINSFAVSPMECSATLGRQRTHIAVLQKALFLLK
jgi:hypothetical protein